MDEGISVVVDELVVLGSGVLEVSEELDSDVVVVSLVVLGTSLDEELVEES